MTFPFHDKILFSSFDRVPTPISSTYSTAYANVMGLKKKILIIGLIHRSYVIFCRM